MHAERESSPAPVPVDPIERLLTWTTTRRLVVVGLFVAVLWLFRSMLLVLAAFGLTRWVLDAGADRLAPRFGISRGRAALLTLLGVLVGAGAAAWVGWATVDGLIATAQAELPSLFERVMSNPLFHQAAGLLHLEPPSGEGSLLDSIDGDMALEGLSVAREFGAALVHALFGVFLAILAMTEEDRLSSGLAALDRRSVRATLVRWIGHVADGLAITVQLQVIVAVCNALLTLPLMWLLDVPFKPAVCLFIVLAGLVPVFGNLVSGALLIALTWSTHGWLAVAVFATLTFLLGKIESFYLNPKLAARHVHLPAFVLTTSLIAWESMAGFIGFFLSFPFLYVVLRIQREFADGDA